MHPQTFGVLELFVKPERYVIPLYQRRYIWTQGRQWQPLWDDIRTKVEEVREKTAQGKQIRPHFLGAIVVAKRQTSGSDLDIYDVVDGQQRLTTFQVFLLAFRDRVKGLDRSVHQRVRAHTRNGNEDLEVRPHEQYKVWPTRFDQPLFTEIWGHSDPDALVQAVQAEQQQHRPVGNIKAAYAFFSTQLAAWLAQDEQHAAALLDTLKQYLQVVRIDLHPEDDPQVIFETLNARGEALQAADLIRNFIFQHAEQQHLDVESLFQQYWAAFDIDRSFWRELVSRGRVRRDQLTWFLTYFLTVQHGREISEGNIFDEFKTWWRGVMNLTVEARLAELKRFADAYLQLNQAAVDTRLGILRVRLDALDTTTLTPVLLYLLTESLPAAELDQILLNLESYLVRRYTAGLTSKNNNQRFLQLLTRLKERQRSEEALSEGALSAAFVRRFLSEARGDSVRWPDDAEFRTHLLNDATYKTLSPRGAVLLLEAAEARLHSDRQELLRFAGTSSVEHVMPRRWEKHWAPPTPDAGTDPAMLAARRDTVLHNLGNLTLVTQKLNASLSNKSFLEKKPHLTKQTLRMLNAYFQDRSTWDEAAIRERAERLADALLQTWPAPIAQGTALPEPIVPDPAVSSDAEKQFDHWLKAPSGYFQVEELEKEGIQGVQFIHRSWSRSWKLVVFRSEEDGEERLTFEVRNDFGVSDPFYARSQAVFARLKEPLELSFGEQLSEVGNGYRIRLDPDLSASELQGVFDRVCVLFIPAVEREITTSLALQAPSALTEVMQRAWPLLPEGWTFLMRDLEPGRKGQQLRIGHASWPTTLYLTYRIVQRQDGRLSVGVQDDTGKAFFLKAALQARWPELVEVVRQAFPGVEEKVGSGISQFVDVMLPLGAGSAEAAETLQALIAATQPLLEQIVAP
ncbi:DUF262 domain-containing protein [Deinococcus ruber]|uniref:DUF262 domain-containing protein n=1 Tax=Deinococcus ruber TaxID=1848197 RepID=A0A918F5Q7_9DEIO|nr:DUF262 domain-containing protein [Deinococcus ruber]GGR11504.1 hypothetical protein GCM10008957_25470 [Deinococcus ruber]